jgi:hypothetical protein
MEATMPEVHAPILFDNPVFRLPLSGAVNQSILPWRWAFDLSGSQLSLFSINLGRSSAPEMEKQILDEVGSYGRQLGRIGEALEVLVKRLPRDQLSASEAAAIEDFSAQMREIAQVKRRASAAEPD